MYHINKKDLCVYFDIIFIDNLFIYRYMFKKKTLNNHTGRLGGLVSNIVLVLLESHCNL